MADPKIEGSMGGRSLIRDIYCRNCSQTHGCSAASRFDEALKKMDEEKAELTGAGKQEKDEDKDKDAGKTGKMAVERFGRRA
jgi:hypothetical protein